jgi:hypothetical protein
MILGPAINPWGPGTNWTNCFVVWWLIVELSQWHTSTKEVSHLYYPYFVSIYPVYPVLEFVFCFKYLQTAMRKNLKILNDYPVVFRDWNCRPDWFIWDGLTSSIIQPELQETMGFDQVCRSGAHRVPASQVWESHFNGCNTYGIILVGKW